MSAAPLEPLKDIPQWVPVRLTPQPGGKASKVPLTRGGHPGNALDPANWLPWAQADALVRQMGPGHGLGFVLTREAGVWCLDIDNCREGDGWSGLAQQLVASLPGAAVERSQSGNGLHVWGRGPVPEHTCKGPAGSGLELYTESRFIALGNGLDPAGGATGSLGAAPGIATVVERYFKPAARPSAPAANATGPRADWSGPTDDDELVQRALTAPSNPARAFQGMPHFRSLWEAEADALGRAFPSEQPGESFDASRADMALAGELAYWTGCDAERMERLMRRSGLARDKWDEHPSYLRDFTIAKACAAGRPVLQDRRPEAQPVPTGMFAPVSVADLFTQPPEPQRWAWDGLVPAGELTLLASHGGVGKSRLALALGASVALGRPFLGREVQRGPVVLLSAEDPPPTVRRRLGALCRAAMIDPAELERSGLGIWDGTAGDPALFAGSPATVTEAGRLLASRLEQARPSLVILDNTSDVYAGNEIDRRDVRAFAQWLARMVRPWGGAVLLLAHVAKTTSRAGARPEDDEGYSGSTAWHNSARSRLFLAPDPDLPEALRLRHQKCNLGPRVPDIRYTWPTGGQPQVIDAPDPDFTMHALVALIGKAHEEATARGETSARLSPDVRSSYCAGKVLSDRTDWPAGVTWRDGQRLLTQAEQKGFLKRAQVPIEGRKQTAIWVPTAI